MVRGRLKLLLAIGAGVGLLAIRVAALVRGEGGGSAATLLIDDAFVSFRYAEHLAAGHGLVFNPGERVEGYTNFLWTLLLAAAAVAGGDVPSAALVLASAAAVGTIVVLTLAAAHLLRGAPGAGPLIAVPPVVFAAFPFQSRYVVSGMETTLFAFLLAAAMLMLIQRRSARATGVTLALLAMTRPEGALYAAALGAAVTVLPRDAAGATRARYIRDLAVVFAVCYGSYFVWRWWYYGALLPQTYYAKVGGAPTLAILSRGLDHLRFAVRESHLELPALLAAASAWRLRRDPVWLVPLTVMAVAATVMVVVGGDFQFFFGPRLLMPAVPAMLLGVVGTLSLLMRFRWRAVGGIAAVAVVAALLLATAVRAWPYPSSMLRTVLALNLTWREVGVWLRDRTPNDSVVAVGAIGRIPYYSRRATIDMLGLAEPAVGRRDIPIGPGLVGHEKYDSPYVLSRRPDYMVFVVLDDRGRPTVPDWPLVEAEFEHDYGLVALVRWHEQGPVVVETREWVPDPVLGAGQVVVFGRREQAIARR